MRLGRVLTPRRAPAEQPAPSRLVPLVQRTLAKTYSDGLQDGTLIALDMIEGRAQYGGIPYSGPLPDELRDYIARVRRNARA